MSIDRSLPEDLAGPVLELIEQGIHNLGWGGRGLEKIGIREEESLERRLRREAGENRVLPLTDDRGFHEIIFRDRGERLAHRGCDLVQAPALDDAKNGLLTGSLLEDTRELAGRERRRDRVRARLQRVLTARVVQDVCERERVTDEALALEATRDRPGSLAAGDDEAPRFGARVLCEIGFRPDTIRDQTADEVLLEKRVVVLNLGNECVLRDRPADHDQHHEREDDDEDERQRSAR